jgi:hypothetical protein
MNEAERAGIEAGMEKAARIMVGGGGVAIGHKKIPAHLNVGYSNLLGVIPVPTAGARVGGERFGVRAGVGVDPTKQDSNELIYVGVDRGVPKGTHAYYSPGVIGRIAGKKGKTWRPKDKK